MINENINLLKILIGFPVGVSIGFSTGNEHGRHSMQAGQDISNIFRISVFSINLYHGNIAAKTIKYSRIVKILILKFNPSSLTNLPSGPLGCFFYL